MLISCHHFLFGFLTLGTVVVLAAYMPQPWGRSLEDIQVAFHHRPAVRGWAHQLRRLFSRSGVSPVESERSSVELNVVAGGNRLGRSLEDAMYVSGLRVDEGGAGTGMERDGVAGAVL
jgi:hypothetical protein